MDATSPATLFAIWERGRRLAPTSRSRVMLRALGFDDAALGTLTVGQRDAILIDLRATGVAWLRTRQWARTA